jgi:hypothetical protein
MVIPMLKSQLGNLQVPGFPGKQGRSSNPLGSLGDLFMKERR